MHTKNNLQVVYKFVLMTTSLTPLSQSAIHETDAALKIELQGTLSITIAAVVEAGGLRKKSNECLFLFPHFHVKIFDVNSSKKLCEKKFSHSHIPIL